MKKLEKLSINTEKLLKNEELVNIRGGYDNSSCNSYCTSNSGCGGQCPTCSPLPNWAGKSTCSS